MWNMIFGLFQDFGIFDNMLGFRILYILIPCWPIYGPQDPPILEILEIEVFNILYKPGEYWKSEFLNFLLSWKYWKTDFLNLLISWKYWKTDFLYFLISWTYWKSDFSNFVLSGKYWKSQFSNFLISWKYMDIGFSIFAHNIENLL